METERVSDGPRLRRAHLWTGLVFLAVFLLTGLYMDKYLGHLGATPEPARMLYRSTHIYLLWSALLNLALGLYLHLSPVNWRRRMQGLGSILVLVGPLLLTAGFFHEPSLEGLLRPWSRPAIYAAYGGMLLHALAAMPVSRAAKISLGGGE